MLSADNLCKPIRPDETSGLICVRNVWYFEGFPEKKLWEKLFWKKKKNKQKKTKEL